MTLGKGMLRAFFSILLAAAAFLPTSGKAAEYIFPQTALVMAGDDPAYAKPELDDSDWEEISLNSLDPQQRILWFRVYVDGAELISLSEEQPLGVFFMALASREVYFNGEKIGFSGVPGATREEEKPGALDAVYFLPEKLIRKGDNVIAVRISSFHLPVRVTGPFHGLFLSEYKPPNVFRRENYLPSIFAGGAIGLGAFYFLGLFAANRKDRASLALSILALAVIGQLAAEAWRAFDLYDYPVHMLRLWFVLGYAIIAGFALSAFTAMQFSPHQVRLVLGVGGGLALISVLLPGYDVKTAFAILSFVSASFIASIIGARNGRPGALIAAVAIAIFFTVFAIDPWNFLDQSYYLLMAGLIMALFILQVRILGNERKAKEEAAFKAMRLRHELLKKQIQPHFLMNTLTALAEWIESDPKTGVTMIDALSGELRLLYDMSEKTLIPLDDELELCQRHLKVMSLRSGGQFMLEIRNNPESVTCPPALFLTLIENAFTHNEYRDDTTFTIDAQTDGGKYSFVFHSPIRAPADRKERTGAGLAYIRARLSEAFGDRWEMTSGAEGELWVTEISWPGA